MSMSRRQLRRLSLAPDVIDAVLQLHEDAVSALKTERDAWQHAAEGMDALTAERDALRNRVQHLQECEEQVQTIQSAFDSYRMQTEGAARRSALETAARDALLRNGANEQAVPLLLRCMELDSLTLTEDGEVTGLVDEAAVVAAVKEQYAAFFAQPQVLQMPAVTPPNAGGVLLTADDLRGMSAEEINGNWQAVKSALAN